MNRYVAFLRGMNLGGRRITNEELCRHMGDLGLASPTAFLASGNVVFDADEDDAERLARKIESGLAEALGYEVPTYLRTGEEVVAIADREPFPAQALEASGGKPQVALVTAEPSTEARDAVLAHATAADRLVLDGRELYWLPSGGILESDLDLAALEARVGPWTMRTVRTIERLADKFLRG